MLIQIETGATLSLFATFLTVSSNTVKIMLKLDGQLPTSSDWLLVSRDIMYIYTLLL
jgi:hypothetical protein